MFKNAHIYAEKYPNNTLTLYLPFSVYVLINTFYPSYAGAGLLAPSFDRKTHYKLFLSIYFKKILKLEKYVLPLHT